MQMKKFLKWFFSIFIGGFIGLIIAAVILDDNSESEQNNNVELEAVTICKMLIEKKLSLYRDINFHSMDRKIFKKENNRYIIKYPISFIDNTNNKKNVQSHCDIQFNGGDKMDTNNWSLLKLEIL
jgi:hypothetical protein